MGRDGRPPVPKIIAPNGQEMTLADLPPRDTVRWVTRRKAAVVMAVQGGLISLNDACTRYALSVEEFLSWQRMVERHGVRGLRVTHTQNYRQSSARP